MPVTIRIDPGIGASAARHALSKILERLQRPDPRKSVQQVAKMWAANYRNEGSMVGGWAQLAASTQKDRADEGFGAAHPILIRYGSLYAMSTLFFMEGRAGSVSSVGSSDGRSIRTSASLDLSGGTAVLGMSGPKTVHQKGNWTPPKRQYWFTDRNIVLAARVGAIEWIRDEVIPK